MREFAETLWAVSAPTPNHRSWRITLAKTKKEAMTVAIEQRAVATRRNKSDRRSGIATAPAPERRVVQRREKVHRRRQIDPTTCERDYTDDEVEFMHALDAYKRSSGRMFPTCSEVLEVLKGLGYQKARLAAAGASAAQATNEA
jgi:hypothetical protein